MPIFDKRLFGSLFALLVLTALSVSGAVYYVDPAGNDAFDGTTEELPVAGGTQGPKRTLTGAMAIPELTAGDVIYAAPGVYDEGGEFAYGLTNRVVVKEGVELISRGHAADTFIEGCLSDQNASGLGTDALRCVTLRPGSVLRGFTLRKGRTFAKAAKDYSVEVIGAGVMGEDALVADCVFDSNNRSAGRGTQAKGSVTLLRCRIEDPAGGSYHCYENVTLIDCLDLAKNSLYYFCKAYNSTFIFAHFHAGNNLVSTGWNCLFYGMNANGSFTGGTSSFYNCRSRGRIVCSGEKVDCLDELDISYDPVTYRPRKHAAVIDNGNAAYRDRATAKWRASWKAHLTPMDYRNKFKTVKASYFGWNPVNATKAIGRAFASGARRIIIDRQASEWLVTTCAVPSNKEIVFEDGVVVRALPGAFTGVTDVLFRIYDASNVVFRGEGTATLKMNKAHYLDKSHYTSGEWRHCVGCLRSQNVVISNLTLSASGGDGVYVAGMKDLTVDSIRSDSNCRQGVSVISVSGLTIRNSSFTRTDGTLPECGIDIEPNNSSCYLENVLITNCQFVANDCHGIAMNYSQMSADSRPISVKVSDCYVASNAYHGLWLTMMNAVQKRPVTGTLDFEHLVVEDNATHPLSLENFSTNGVVVSFKDCLFDGRKAEQGLQFTSSTDLGVASFSDCTLKVQDDVPALSYVHATGSGVVGMTGLVTVERPSGTEVIDLETWGAEFPSDPELRKFEQKEFTLTSLYPVDATAPVPANLWSPTIRGSGSLLVRVPAAGEYGLSFTTCKIGQNFPAKEGSITVYDSQGTTHAQASLVVTREETTEFTLVAQGANLYRIVVDPNGMGFKYRAAFSGSGVYVLNRTDFIGAQNRRLYFGVPAGSRTVKVELSMPVNEPMSAHLLDADGVEVDRCITARQVTILAKKMAEPAASDQIWSLVMDNFREDGDVRIGGDAIPVLSLTPEAVLLPKGGDR